MGGGGDEMSMFRFISFLSCFFFFFSSVPPVMSERMLDHIGVSIFVEQCGTVLAMTSIHSLSLFSPSLQTVA